jgi:hypothetical protein
VLYNINWGDVQMKRMGFVLGLICALVVMSVASATASANQICHGPAPVRRAPDPGSGIWGWLNNGETFQVYNPAAGNFFYGYAFGGINHTGYVNGNYLC